VTQTFWIGRPTGKTGLQDVLRQCVELRLLINGSVRTVILPGAADETVVHRDNLSHVSCVEITQYPHIVSHGGIL
jgi:hypothetical protein